MQGLRNESQFVQTLEESWEVKEKAPEISGWSEILDMSSERTCLLSQDRKRLRLFLNKEAITRKPSKRKLYVNSRPLIIKFNSPGQNNFDRKPEQKGKVIGKPKIFIRRNHRQSNSEGYTYGLQVTAVPLLKNSQHLRNQSAITEKRHIKLDEYYDRSFLVVQNSPPTVSGYSVTFYHK